MSPGRRKARRQAVIILYQQDLLGLSPVAALERNEDGNLDDYTRALVLGVGENATVIDTVLRPHVTGWSLERLGVLERSILRLGTFELLFEPGVPAAVVIDEAVELAKRFCSDEAGALINGILGSLAVSRAEEIAKIRDTGSPRGESGR